jgi:hypothetical protein
LTCLAWEALPVAYATASIALGIMWPHKPHHYVIYIFLDLFSFWSLWVTMRCTWVVCSWALQMWLDVLINAVVVMGWICLAEECYKKDTVVHIFGQVRKA